MICVGTPGRPNGQLNVEAVARFGEEIGQALKSRTALSSRDTLHDSLHVARQGPQVCPKAAPVTERAVPCDARVAAA
jgi:hypothetical protein